MANIFNFQDKNNDTEIRDNITLNSWIEGKSDEEVRRVFLRMDETMKYIHDKGYCIKTFNPKEIELIEGSPNKIKYNVLLEMPKRFDVQKELVREDIYNSSYLQIGIYTKCLDKMNPSFLKENFNSFATFLPEEDVPYYQGVIQRGAPVYLSEYNKERRNKDLNQLEEQLEGNSNSNSKPKVLVKSNGLFSGSSDDDINDKIYSQIDNREAAFVSFLIFPTIVLLVGIAVAVIAWVASLG